VTLQGFIGIKSSPVTLKVASEDRAFFGQVVQESEPSDLSPVFFTKYRKGELEILDKMQVPLKSILHGEQTYHYEPAAWESFDSIEFDSSLESVLEKKGGSMVILIVLTQMRNAANQEVLVNAKSTFIVRNG